MQHNSSDASNAAATVWAHAYTFRLQERYRVNGRPLTGAARDSEASEFAERAVRHFLLCVARDFETEKRGQRSAS